MTLANKITIARILLIPVFIIGLLENARGWPVVIFILSSLTDVLDGAAARWRKEKTVLGSFLDPVADKLLIVSTYLTLSHLRLIPMWVFVVVFSRDLLILIGWNIIYVLTQNASLTPRWLGKSTTLLEMLTVIVLLIPPLRTGLPFFLWTMVVVTAASTADYIWVGAKKLNELDMTVRAAD